MARRRNHIISRRKIREFAESHPGHPDAIPALDRWYRIAERAIWDHFGDVRATFASADLVDDLVVFNVGGNKFRVIAEIFFEDCVILLRHVLTHEEYDRGRWKAGNDE